MLTVGVELDGDIVIVFFSVFIAGLDSAADPEISNQVNMLKVVFF